MHASKLSFIRLAHTSSTAVRTAAREAITRKTPPPPFPVIASCPSPKCPCAEMPDGLDIDMSKDLNGTAAPYSQHVLISSGRSDWKSKIEDERNTSGWGKFTSDVKQAFARGGEFHDPYNNVLISTSSFTLAAHSSDGPGQIEALVFPSFRHVRTTLKNDEETRNVIKSSLVDEESRKLSGDYRVNPITAPTILICTHSNRDSRCGVLGPILMREFANVLSQAHLWQPGVEFDPQHTVFTPEKTVEFSIEHGKHVVNLGAISHVGGHKWAGNVILYIPPSYNIGSGAIHPLSGKGIWYGRVQPMHVQGIVEETLVNGRVIKDLFRGGVDASGQTLRM